MSQPQNILGKFRSYAYHHILMVCNNTAAAEALIDTTEITVFQRPSSNPRDEKLRYAPRSIGGDPRNKYITLIDGTADARFYITEASWENIIAMENTIGTDGIPESTSMSLEGELEIIEPLGARFLNTLTRACDSLETDPVGLVFVLKTIFVGHRDDGISEMITNVKPLLFVNYDITAIFDSSGAKYKMMFVGAVNGMGKLPHTQKIFNGLNFSVTDVSLEKTFENIAEKVNAKYNDFLKRAKLEFTRTLYEDSVKNNKPITPERAVTEATAFFEKNYRPVKYKIFAPDYADASKYKAGDNEPVRIKNERELGSFNFGDNISVEEIIKKVMASSTGVINDGTGKGDKDGKKYIYKIVSGLNSTADGFIVEYHVKKYEMAIVPYDAIANGEDFQPAKGQSITFNYIFTGKNVDIKEFDIKMEMGMAFFQIAATTDTMPDQESVAKGKKTAMLRATGASKVASNGKTVRPKTPLFLGGKMKQPMARNTRNPSDAASFQALLNRHAALENIEAKMLIYGNPQLLDELQVSPRNLSKTETEPPKEGATVNPRWLSTPTVIKVNIKMPVDANDVNTEYEDFWYTGYYSLFAVKQIFQDGEFLQELDLMSIPVGEKIDEKKDNTTTSIEEQEKAEEAFIDQARAILEIDPPEPGEPQDPTTEEKEKIKEIEEERKDIPPPAPETDPAAVFEDNKRKKKLENVTDIAKDGDKRTVAASRAARRRLKKARAT